MSVLSSVSKPLEKHISIQITNFLDEHDLLYSKQSGFRSNSSCQTALTNITENIYDSLNNNLLSGAIFFDFTKAFDLISHNIILKKLQLYNFSTGLLSFIGNYLSNSIWCTTRLNFRTTPI